MRKRVFTSNRQFGIFVLALALVISIAGIAHRTAQAKSIQHSPPYIVSQAQVDQTKITYSKPKPLRPNYKLNLKIEYQDLIWDLCQKNDISYELVLAVFYHESAGFKLNATNRNADGSVDRGIAAINSYYEDAYREHAIDYGDFPTSSQFDPLNPDHSIRAGIGGLVNLRNLLRSKGTNEEDLVWILLGNYNRGVGGMNTYIKRNKTIHTPYAEIILKHKYNLEKNGTF